MRRRTCHLLLGLAWACSIVAPAQAQERYVYWTALTNLTNEPKSVILRGSLDNARIDTVRQAEVREDGAVYFTSVAVDTIYQRIYWLETKGGTKEGVDAKVMRANLDGTDPEVVVDSRICGIGSWADLELDLWNRLIFWSYNGSCGLDLMRANLDGNIFIESLIPGNTGDPFYIALDPLAQQIYFSMGPPYMIRRVRYDGSQVETVLDDANGGIALDLVAGNLYIASGESIRRASLEGTELEDVVVGVGRVTDIALDVQDGKIYWTERESGNIRRANLDGSGVEDLFVGLQAPHRLALSFENSIAVANETSGNIPEGYALWPNYPNPFNPSTTIRFDLPAASHVSLVVYDLLGREVAQVVDEMLAAGVHHATWEAGTLPSGLYVYALRAGSFHQSRLLLLLK